MYCANYNNNVQLFNSSFSYYYTIDPASSFVPADHAGKLEIIELVKPNQGGLGLMICEQEDHPQNGVFVQNVVKAKAAYLDGRIHPGDKILAINGQDVSMARQDYVVRLLQVNFCACSWLCIHVRMHCIILVYLCSICNWSSGCPENC